jgi:DNA-binding NtrC family response regulator
MSIFDVTLREASSIFVREYITLQLYLNRGDVTKTAKKIKIERGSLVRIIREGNLQSTVQSIRKGSYAAPANWQALSLIKEKRPQ